MNNPEELDIGRMSGDLISIIDENGDVIYHNALYLRTIRYANVPDSKKKFKSVYLLKWHHEIYHNGEVYHLNTSTNTVVPVMETLFI